MFIVLGIPKSENSPVKKQECHFICDLPTPEGWKAELTLVLVIYRDDLAVHRQSSILVVTTASTVFLVQICQLIILFYFIKYKKNRTSVLIYGWTNIQIKIKLVTVEPKLRNTKCRNLDAAGQLTACNTRGRGQAYPSHRTVPSQTLPMRTDAVWPSETDGKTTADSATNVQHSAPPQLVLLKIHVFTQTPEE